jgi:hypothetical protein
MAADDFAKSAERDELIKKLELVLMTANDDAALEKAGDLVSQLCSDHADDAQIVPSVFGFVHVVAENAAALMETDGKTAEFLLLVFIGFDLPPDSAVAHAVTERLPALFDAAGDKAAALEMLAEYIDDDEIPPGPLKAAADLILQKMGWEPEPVDDLPGPAPAPGFN